MGHNLGGHISLKKHDSLINLIGFGPGISPVYKQPQRPSFQRIFISYAAFTKSKAMMKIK